MVGGLLALTAIAAGCSAQTQQRAQDAAQATSSVVESAATDTVRNAERAGDAVRDAAKTAQDGVQKAGETADGAGASLRGAASTAKEAVKEAVNDVARAGGAALETADVKAALVGDPRVDAADINVDTDHRTNTVTLKGHVPSAAQKSAAEEIARAKAVGYIVKNELVILR
jgi:osmotically-inducible protein OsmY